ncbi:MAG: aldehyde dehydrogenase family protein, partial [Marmoricola sp.]
MDTFDSLNPGTGAVVGTYPIATEAEVREAVARAREAAAWWATLSFGQREAILTDWKALITQRIEELAEVMRSETGKPASDAALEVGLAVDHLGWAAGHAEKVLKRKSRASGMVMANMSASVEYRPLGVIGVIGPWNYPVFTPMGSIAYALAAGNAVVFKPSEYTPGVGVWLARTFAEVCDRPVFQVVTGYGATGAALCESGVNKLAFTGSTATGRKIMAACASTLTPVLIEAGGKDAMIVDE